MANNIEEYLKQAEKTLWHGSPNVSPGKGALVGWGDPILQNPLTPHEMFKPPLRTCHWLYTIDGDHPPIIMVYPVLETRDFEAVVGRVVLNGGFVKLLHTLECPMDKIPHDTVKLETPFKVINDKGEVVFELNDPEWIAKATANILGHDGSAPVITGTGDGFYQEMMNNLGGFSVIKKRRVGQSDYMNTMMEMQRFYNEAAAGLSGISEKYLGNNLPTTAPVSTEEMGLKALQDKIVDKLSKFK